MIAVYDKRLPCDYSDRLATELGDAGMIPFGTADMPCEEAVYRSIESHPDIYFFQAGPASVICAPGLAKEEILPLVEAGVMAIKGKTNPCGEYPLTARYNAVRVGDAVFHDTGISDPIILRIAKENGLRMVNVTQGYTRCSVLPVGDSALVTSDAGIAATAESEGFDVLLISSGDIVLPGENYGFIGGTAGVTPQGDIIFLGDIAMHPAGEDIAAFLKAHDVSWTCLEGLPLYDAGSLFIF